MATKLPTIADQDASDARQLVEAAQIAVMAIESIRSRMQGNRDATAATGHLLEAIVAAGGSLREYDRRHAWAMRHAVGGESHAFAGSHDAAAHVLSAVVHSLRPARSEDEATRQKTAQADMLALSKILKLSEHSIEATKNVEQYDVGVVAAKAAADKAAHDARIAAGGSKAFATMPATAPKPARKAVSKGPANPAPDGDYALPGSVDAPGGNAFPTDPTVG